MIAIWKREVQSYFLTPVGYVFMGVFLMLGSVFFAVNNLALVFVHFLFHQGNDNIIFLCRLHFFLYFFW